MRRNVNKWREAIASHIRACTKCKGVDTPVPLYACRINYRQHSVRPQCTQLQPWFTWFLFITPRLQRIKNPHVIWSFHRQKGGFWKSSRALHWMNYVLWEMAVLHVENFALVRPKVFVEFKINREYYKRQLHCNLISSPFQISSLSLYIIFTETKKRPFFKKFGRIL